MISSSHPSIHQLINMVKCTLYCCFAPLHPTSSLTHPDTHAASHINPTHRTSSLCQGHGLALCWRQQVETHLNLRNANGCREAFRHVGTNTESQPFLTQYASVSNKRAIGRQAGRQVGRPHVTQVKILPVCRRVHSSMPALLSALLRASD